MLESILRAFLNPNIKEYAKENKIKYIYIFFFIITGDTLCVP